MYTKVVKVIKIVFFIFTFTLTPGLATCPFGESNRFNFNRRTAAVREGNPNKKKCRKTSLGYPK